MKSSAKFLLVAILALVVPLILTLIDRHGMSLTSAAADIPKDWLELALPQLLVVILALLFPALRPRFAIAALISLTALLLLFICIIHFGSDPNGGMLLVFFFPLSAVVLIVVAFIVSVRGRVRGSNNRSRVP